MNKLNRYFKKISLVLAVVVLLQISLPEWLTLSQPIKAAAQGPIIVSTSPADDFLSVVPSAKLTFTFDESITKVNGSATITIYEYDTNTVFESFVVASSGAVTIDSTGKVVTIQPSKPFQENTEYYVNIEPGAFANVSNGANFNGIASTYEWNFKTGVQVNRIPPVLQAHSPALGALDVPITSSVSMTFDEEVYVASGEFSLVSDLSSTTLDNRQIPVTSNQVTGSGSKTITITPSVALYPNTTYTFSIPNGVIQDSSGNKYPGYSWSFKTAAAPLKAPPTVTKLEYSGSTITMTYNEALNENSIPAVSRFYITVNGVNRPATAISISGVTVKVTLSNVIMNGQVVKLSYSKPSSGGIQDLLQNQALEIANRDVTPLVDPIAPTLVIVSTYPINNTSNVLTDSDFTAEFSETVVKGAGSIWIKPIGSKTAQDIKTNFYVDGTNTTIVHITLPTGVRLEGSTNYYIEIASDAIVNLAGNTFSGIQNQNEWTFKTIAVDTIPPTVTKLEYSGSTITMTLNEDLNGNSIPAVSSFYITVDGVSRPATAISISGATVKVTLSSAIMNGQVVKLSYSKPSSGGIQDLLQNQALDISNRDVTPLVGPIAPTLVSGSVSGNTITLTFNKELATASSNAYQQFSVYIAGNYYSASSLNTSGRVLTLTFNGTITDRQSAYITYLPSTHPITDTDGVNVAAFSSYSLANATSSSNSNSVYTPVSTGTSSLNSAIVIGKTLTLTFNETLNTNYIPSVNSFSIMSQNVMLSVEKVTISGSVVTLTLNSSPKIGKAVYISYYPSANGIHTTSGQTIEGFASTSVANQTTLNSLLGEYTEAVGGGIDLKISAATTTSAVSPAGTSTNKYSISALPINNAYEAAKSAGMNKLRVVFKVPDTERAAIVAVPLSTLQNAANFGKGASFAVQYNDITYEIPVQSLNYSEISRILGSSEVVGDLLIKIDQGETGLINSLTSAINRLNASILAGPVHFEVVAAFEATEKKIPSFSGNVSRSMDTVTSIEAKSAAVVWYDPEADALSYVPTLFTTSGGKTVATFKSKGNSAYALVRGSANYTDIGKHWAGTTIQALARKFIVEGRTTTKFEPEQSMTRGEFATYISKGLGLSGNKSAASKFKDVNTGATMAAYIGAVSEAGIVMGNTDGTFKPDSLITRQEMAVMMTRAAATAEVTVSLPSSASSYLEKYNDHSKISSWAKNDVAKAVYTGVISGQTTTTLSPLTHATRAEAVVMIQRLLESVNLLEM
ncbi:hypothetical protein EJP82_16965 [Paenibacillus anaericanus]|uniref:SLH domain-containing protein n=1 Tax=Paenibacillus anaericanus TaxID=170367 RepID=A0A433Y6K3_9BACL|nr:hypothetical protein EJP82_16965 [Paenibacillus anaericanus]